MQQLALVVHACPVFEQVFAIWQVPVAPLNTQVMPEQQSPAAVHTEPCGWQVAGAWHWLPVQIPEQQSLPVAQVAPLALQVTPASAVPPSELPVLPSVMHTEPSSEVTQAVPAQQLDADGLQVVPTGSQVAAGVHTDTPPSGWGRHSSPLQH